MRHRDLGKTGFQVSKVGFGGWAIGGNTFGDSYGATDDAESLAALNRAYELGCNYFDTADVYGHGHSEALLGQALQGWRRDEVFISTTVGQDFSACKQSQSSSSPSEAVKPNFSTRYIHQAVEASLRRLGLETIDLYQLHTPPLALIQHAEVFETLQTLQQQGKIRFYGIVVHDPQEGIQAIQRGKVAAVQAVYNLFDTRIDKMLLPTCQETQTALIAREPLARGFLSGAMSIERSFEPGDNRFVWPKPLVQRRVLAANQFKEVIPAHYHSLGQLALAFSSAHPAVSTVLVGCKTRKQVEENFAVASLPRLSDAEMTAIQEIQARLY